MPKLRFNSRLQLRRLGGLLLAILTPLTAAHAAEGMWTLDNLPKEAMARQYRFSPDQAWVDNAMQASVRLANGCSGSFVSSNGLVLTNHHCVEECTQQLSTAQNNLIDNGFLAKNYAEERQCPALEINRLDKITDVTDKLEAATRGKKGADFANAQKAEKARLESECTGTQGDTLRCDVVELYHGGRYSLYRYHRFQDVRLSFAPEARIAFFGGDPDNFMFPRYNLDMSLLRVYENGAPAKVTHYFPFKREGAKAGELTMVTGHPGSTQRQLTVAQLEFLRDVSLPQRLFHGSELRGLLTRYGAEGEEQARTSRSLLFMLENGIKVRKGQLYALQDPEVFAFKRKQEQALRAYVNGNAKLKAQYGSAWDAIAKAQVIKRRDYWPLLLLENDYGFDSDYAGFARTLLRGTEEKLKPNAERLAEYGDARLPEVEQHLFSTAPIYPEFEKLRLGFTLSKLREHLGPDSDIVKQVLGRESPEALAARLVDGTRLGDLAVRKQLWAGGKAAVEASNDPFIVLMRGVDAKARELRRIDEEQVKAVEAENAGKIAAALFAMKGASVYPDATFTLRLSYGEVKGWEEDGKTIAPFTKLAGGYERATGADPFALPESWLQNQDKLALDTPFDFVTTNDIIGGNSGSPVINQNAQLVGLAFDGNIHSLGGSYWYDERLNRAVSVHSAAMLEALRKVYKADRLADELIGK